MGRGSPVHLEWGPRGAHDAAERGDVVVLIDVLSFATTVTAAVAQGATIVPFEWGDAEAADAEAARLGAERLVGPRRALSPEGMGPAARGRTFLLCSPNGATCSRIAAPGAAVVLGCLRNASAAAATAAHLADAAGVGITVVPCGERWLPGDNAPEQGLRPAVEDHLGAGAVIAALAGDHSFEARIAAHAFAVAREDLHDGLLASVSGQELVGRGYQADVVFAAAHDVTTAVPVLRTDRFVAA
jgi:2-phosphosulfolactate phosphatase